MKTTKSSNGIALSKSRIISQRDVTGFKKNGDISQSKKKFLTLHLAEEDAIFSLALLFFRKTL